MEELGEEAMHQEALGKVPGTQEVERILIVGHVHDARVVNYLRDPYRDRLIKVKPVYGRTILVLGEQQAKKGHEQNVRGLEVEYLGPFLMARVIAYGHGPPVIPLQLTMRLWPRGIIPTTEVTDAFSYRQINFT